jgi:hypothetical protein
MKDNNDDQRRERAAEEHGKNPAFATHFTHSRIARSSHLAGWDACAAIKDREIAELKARNERLLDRWYRSLDQKKETAELRAKVVKLERVVEAARSADPSPSKYCGCDLCIALAALEERDG